MPLKTFRVPVGLTVISVVAAFILGGPEIGLIVTLLAILEISISFDNAIVNAHILKTMTPRWQQIFLTWGILIAVFGMRLVFPIVIVAAAAGLNVVDVVDQALNEPDLYAENLEEAYAIIAAFGGIFLLMVFLNFFFDDEKDVHWAGPLEGALSRAGVIHSIGPAIGCATLLLISQIVSPELEKDVLVAGLVGLVAYMVSHGIAESLEPDDIDEDEFSPGHDPQDSTPSGREAAAAAAAMAGKGGFASFMYLELIDASFSFDGVIGAFAISRDIIVIAVGLGLGALYIRTLTVYLVRQGTLAKYRYLEHGAHWAIGALAVLLFVGIEHHVPEVITGSLGALLIIGALVSSIRINKHEENAANA